MIFRRMWPQRSCGSLHCRYDRRQHAILNKKSHKNMHDITVWWILWRKTSRVRGRIGPFTAQLLLNPYKVQLANIKLFSNLQLRNQRICNSIATPNRYIFLDKFCNENFSVSMQLSKRIFLSNFLLKNNWLEKRIK